MQPIQIKLGLVIEADAINALSQLVGQIIRQLDQDTTRREDYDTSERRRMTPLEASRQAIFAGKKPPTDRGLLVDSREVAKLLKVSERTIYKTYMAGEMPPPIRIGRAVRWSLDELQNWIRSGCPKSQGETKQPKVNFPQAQPTAEGSKGIRSGFSELYTDLGLDPADFPKLTAREIIQIAGDASDAFRNWTCGVPMTAAGTNLLREQLRKFAAGFQSNETS